MRPSILEISIVVLFFLILFGARKIPEVMRGLGIGIKEFKSGLQDSDSKAAPNEKSTEDKPN